MKYASLCATLESGCTAWDTLTIGLENGLEEKKIYVLYDSLKGRKTMYVL